MKTFQEIHFESNWLWGIGLKHVIRFWKPILILGCPSLVKTIIQLDSRTHILTI